MKQNICNKSQDIDDMRPIMHSSYQQLDTNIYLVLYYFHETAYRTRKIITLSNFDYNF